MTIIVTGVTTKKALKECVKAFNERRRMAQCPLFRDPSFVSPLFGGTRFTLGCIINAEQRIKFTCTNHPKRSRFAEVQVLDGKVVVS